MRGIFMKQRSRWLIIVAALLLISSLALIHKAYAGKSAISLNSPASFPVDI